MGFGAALSAALGAGGAALGATLLPPPPLLLPLLPLLLGTVYLGVVTGLVSLIVVSGLLEELNSSRGKNPSTCRDTRHNKHKKKRPFMAEFC